MQHQTGARGVRTPAVFRYYAAVVTEGILPSSRLQRRFEFIVDLILSYMPTITVWFLCL